MPIPDPLAGRRIIPEPTASCAPVIHTGKGRPWRESYGQVDANRVLTTGHAGCTFTVRQTRTGAIPEAGGKQTPTRLARKRGTCRRFAVPVATGESVGAPCGSFLHRCQHVELPELLELPENQERRKFAAGHAPRAATPSSTTLTTATRDMRRRIMGHSYHDPVATIAVPVRERSGSRDPSLTGVAPGSHHRGT